MHLLTSEGVGIDTLADRMVISNPSTAKILVLFITIEQVAQMNNKEYENIIKRFIVAHTGLPYSEEAYLEFCLKHEIESQLMDREFILSQSANSRRNWKVQNPEWYDKLTALEITNTGDGIFANFHTEERLEGFQGTEEEFALLKELCSDDSGNLNVLSYQIRAGFPEFFQVIHAKDFTPDFVAEVASEENQRFLNLLRMKDGAEDVSGDDYFTVFDGKGPFSGADYFVVPDGNRTAESRAEIEFKNFLLVLRQLAQQSDVGRPNPLMPLLMKMFGVPQEYLSKVLLLVSVVQFHAHSVFEQRMRGNPFAELMQSLAKS
jgi:hypothetical protein